MLLFGEEREKKQRKKKKEKKCGSKFIRENLLRGISVAEVNPGDSTKTPPPPLPPIALHCFALPQSVLKRYSFLLSLTNYKIGILPVVKGLSTQLITTIIVVVD